MNMKTKKMRIVTILLLAVMCFALLTGCGGSDEPAPAPAPAPEASDGAASTDTHEHEWADADCTNPKTCEGCGETEGEALGHKLSDATYQAAPKCSVCDAVVGDALTPDFENLGIELDFLAAGDTADYITVDGNGADITGKATLSSYEILPSYQEIEAREGYECRLAIFDVVFGSDALTSGVLATAYFTDYYNVDLFDEYSDNSNEVYTVTNVNFNGEDLPIYVAQSGEYSAEGNQLKLKVKLCFQVPIGYDGSVCGLVNGAVCSTMDNIADYYSPENFVLFRMK